MSDGEPNADEPKWYSRVENSNSTSEGASVGAQVGANYGEVHTQVSATYIQQGDSPEELLRVAVNYLVAGSARPAEKLLHELMWGRQPTTKTAYYYALSILGDRSIYEIDSDLVKEIRRTGEFCSSRVPDSWGQALDVVMGLLRCLSFKTGEESSFDATWWDGQWEGLRAFDGLPIERQEEIRRNLTLIAGGQVRERLEAGARERVLSAKVEADRAKRVWKYFEPDPLEPKQYQLPPLKPNTFDWRWLAGGPALLVLGTIVLATNHVWAALLVLGVLLGGVWLLLPIGVDVAARRLVAEAEERERQRLRTLPEPKSPGHYVPTKLVTELCRLVDNQFAKVRPHRRGRWEEQTTEVRAYLKERLVAQYGNSQRSADAVKWLAWWYARRTVALDGPAWQPADQSKEDQVEAATARRHLAAGVAVTVVTLTVLVVLGQVPAALFLAVGEVWTAVAAQLLAATRRATALRKRAEQRLLVEDQRGFEEWKQHLDDRPTDAEMARWLAMDKAHVRYEAIEQAGLTERDVVSHAVMTWGAYGARRHRHQGGPIRYSAYMARIFVLSYNGVQEFTARLDFETGDILDERQSSFRYEHVVSSSGKKNGERRVRDVKGNPTRSHRIRSVSFKLELTSGREAVSVQESYHRPIDDAALDDDDDSLTDLVLRDSGFESVRRILASVASEGPDWIRRDQEHRVRLTKSLFD
ncbi:hypothetical protein [Frankia gtarii]|uniref:hypothetical protein n=1 Tax=Frankia gtarii TaxID=2950102 RepID=UPI0021C10685|nr:hypothetical protein [Frankia gtarii]